jgi:16S rRNA (adenine1518-N6/adenine1519-N6)-dimethyltransferase
MHPKPKKSLGQNFLVDKNILNKIISSCGFNNCDTILEIGAGRGELTGLLAQRAKKLFAVEIDADLYLLLKEKFKDQPNAEIIHQDILKFDFKKKFKKEKIKVVGNIPYYISSPIIEHLFKYRDKIGSIYLTVQKEFARRVVAHSGSKDYGSFSCFVQYYSEPKILFYISKGCFYPAPKVDSAFLRLEVRKKPILSAAKEKILFRITRAAFNQRRKTLRNSLKGVITRQKLDKFFAKFAIDSNIRPEQLSLQDFANLAVL